MAYFLSPVGNYQVVTDSGNPAVGYYWSAFLAGTSTPATTYTDNTGATAQPTQITLDASGRTANPIWILGGTPLKFRLYDTVGVAQDADFDNVSGTNDSTVSGYVNTNVVNVFTKTLSVTSVTITTVTNHITTVASASNNNRVILTENTTLDNPSAMTDGMVLNWYIKQDGTGGRTMAYGSKFKSKNGAGLTVGSAANAKSLLSCYYDATDDILICAIVPSAA